MKSLKDIMICSSILTHNYILLLAIITQPELLQKINVGI